MTEIEYFYSGAFGLRVSRLGTFHGDRPRRRATHHPQAL